MTEQEWLARNDPERMLEFLNRKASERKLRLFACACCRRLSHLLIDEPRRKALEHAQAFADGLTSSASLHQVLSNAMGEYQGGGVSHLDGALLDACYHHPWGEAAIAHTISLVDNAASAAAGGPPWDDAWMRARIPEFGQQARLLRDVFGVIYYTKTLFRPVLIDPAWLSWNDGAIRKLAQTIYDERAFDRLPLLADALEDAGCGDAEILAHCRGPGPHVRGCWVVDLALDKK